ncbi:hypothetical protein B7P43_G18230 [Cryptotermes secundus]|uniref:Uncharacterized protein n=1 Tax=Cryptotermes secundus TaxID=105785 RepID=A0A2J7PB71_9NEOP|nr:hypothetical protein B7P43_G18230 [Cryptotermes secundus]
MVNITSYFCVRDGVLLLFKDNASFGDCTYNTNLIRMLVNSICVPVLAWLDTPTVVQYFKNLNSHGYIFQAMFVKVTEEHVTLNIKRRCIYCSIFTCVLDSTAIALHFLPPYLEIWKLPCYFVCFLVMNKTISFFGNMLRGLFISATILNKCFKVRKNRI